MGGKYFDERYGSGADGYFEGSENHFNYNAFSNGGRTTYRNPRTEIFDQKRYQTSGARFSVWDIIAPVFPIPTLTLSLFTKKKK